MTRMLRRSDMDKLLELADAVSDGNQMTFSSSEPPPGLGQERVAGVLRAFYASLFATVAPQFVRLQDPETRENTRYRTGEAVAEAYSKVLIIIMIILYN